MDLLLPRRQLSQTPIVAVDRQRAAWFRQPVRWAVKKQPELTRLFPMSTAMRGKGGMEV